MSRKTKVQGMSFDALKRQFEPRQSGSEVVCSKCGVRTTVPFVPIAGKPVYCRNCLAEKRREREDKESSGNISGKGRSK
jgi:CxxC-x17-CxxC domain-containing protein